MVLNGEAGKELFQYQQRSKKSVFNRMQIHLITMRK